MKDFEDFETDHSGELYSVVFRDPILFREEIEDNGPSAMSEEEVEMYFEPCETPSTRYDSEAESDRWEDYPDTGVDERETEENKPDI